jgi:hypothetical protein
MSAHCSTCGTDIVYPEGSWPLGECPVCTRDERIVRLERVVEAARAYAHGRGSHQALLDALRALDEEQR